MRAKACVLCDLCVYLGVGVCIFMRNMRKKGVFFTILCVIMGRVCIYFTILCVFVCKMRVFHYFGCEEGRGE